MKKLSIILLLALTVLANAQTKIKPSQVTPTVGTGSFVLSGSPILTGTVNVNGTIFSSGKISGQDSISFNSPTSKISLENLKSNTSPAIYMTANGVARTGTNYSLFQNAGAFFLNDNSGSNTVNLLGGNSVIIQAVGNKTTGVNSTFVIQPQQKSGATASTEARNIIFSGGTRGWQTGALALQRAIHFTSATYTAVAASVFTDVHALNVEKATAGTNVTITNNWGIVANGWQQFSERVRIGSTAAPTAQLHFAAGTTAANTAPIKFTAGALNTTTVSGQFETDASNNLFYTNATSRYQVGYFLTGSATLDFPSTAASTSSTLTINVTGAALNDPVTVGVPAGAVPTAGTNGGFDAWVSAAGVVTVRFQNTNPGAAFDPASGTFKVLVNKN